MFLKEAIPDDGRAIAQYREWIVPAFDPGGFARLYADLFGRPVGHVVHERTALPDLIHEALQHCARQGRQLVQFLARVIRARADRRPLVDPLSHMLGLEPLVEVADLLVEHGCPDSLRDEVSRAFAETTGGLPLSYYREGRAAWIDVLVGLEELPALAGHRPLVIDFLERIEAAWHCTNPGAASALKRWLDQVRTPGDMRLRFHIRPGDETADATTSVPGKQPAAPFAAPGPQPAPPPTAAGTTPASAFAAQPASSTRPHVDVGILTIRRDELDAVLAVFPDVAGQHAGPHRLYTLRRADAGNGEHYTVAVLRQDEQGNGEAQDAAHDRIADLSPRLVIVVGIAGGLPSSDLTLGDVVVGKRIHDFTVEARKAKDRPAYAASGGPIPRALASLVSNLSKGEFGDWTAGLRRSRR